MDGHYHVEFQADEDQDPEDESLFVNGNIGEVKKAIDESKKAIVTCHFVCTYGCGLPHRLTLEDLDKLELTPAFVRKNAENEVWCTKCGTAVNLKPGESTTCPDAECGRKVYACHCGGSYTFSKYCGVEVCDKCDAHRGMVRCYCGWSAGGGDGKAELEEMGETIDEDGG